MNTFVPKKFRNNLFKNEEDDYFLLYKYLAIYKIDEKTIELIVWKSDIVDKLVNKLKLVPYGPLGDGTYVIRCNKVLLPWILSEQKYQNRNEYTKSWLRNKEEKLGMRILHLDKDEEIEFSRR